MKTILRLRLGVSVVGSLLLTTPATRALADQYGPYYATPSWDQQIPAATRFVVMANWASAAVLDRETGLVWEKSPDVGRMTFLYAQRACMSKRVGGRAGWKLPSIQELSSLIDPTVTYPALPPGHPFLNIKETYWSSTSFATDPHVAYEVNFGAGYPDFAGKTEGANCWCVRGGSGNDAQ